MSKSQIQKKNKKYTFTLKNVDMDEIEEKYNLSFISNIYNPSNNSLNNNLEIKQNNFNNFSNLTQIEDLKKEKIKFFSYLDETKKLHKCHVTMIDFKSKQTLKSYNCFWCRHNIPSHILPLGCPIKYVHSKVIKSYKSEISKDTYTIKEDICENDSINKNELEKINKNYYLTDGVFCSFGCVKSFIKQNISNPLYNNSNQLLLRLYNDIHNISITSIKENFEISQAPSWRLLKTYGGHLSINEFRKGLNTINWIEEGHSEPNYISIQHLYRRRIIF